jgi:uncharacterized protein YbjT (DUF2867 family)
VDRLILVTGATGYIASNLIPRLLDSGYRVRALARDPLRLKGRIWFNKVEIVQADVTSASAFAHALDGVHTAYYLIHQMSHGPGYTSLELDSARAFASEAGKAGVEQIIYLGGLADPEGNIALHMRSRLETGEILRAGTVPVTEFRVGVVTGSGSISFEMIRFMTELLPIIPGPAWLKNKTQPIAIRNVMDYLLAALNNPVEVSRVFEIGGPQVTDYGDLMIRYARIRGLKRSLLMFRRIPVWFMAFGVGLMTPVSYPIAYVLIESLSADCIVQHPEALKTFPEVHLVDFDSAVQEALEKIHPDRIVRVWEDGRQKTKFLKHEGCFVIHRVSALPENHRVGRVSQNRHTLFGEMWFEAHAEGTILTQTLLYSPRGLPGFLYWYLLYPFHLLSLRGFQVGIGKQSLKS